MVFFALNYALRKKNAESGSYFVTGFHEKGPKSLDELQQEILKGNTEWVSKIQYYSFRVKGSAGYWRHKRSEVYTWINHHVAVGAGPPSLFMTFSCADEYYWPEIKTLLKQRYEVADLPVPDFVEGNFIQHIKDPYPAYLSKVERSRSNRVGTENN